MGTDNVELPYKWADTQQKKKGCTWFSMDEGKFKTGDGDVYWGKADKYGKPHGRGLYIWRGNTAANSGPDWDKWHPGDEMYEGQWRNGLKHGEGVYTDADGKRYAGKFADDYCYFYTPDESPDPPSNSVESITEFRADTINM